MKNLSKVELVLLIVLIIFLIVGTCFSIGMILHYGQYGITNGMTTGLINLFDLWGI